MRFEEIFEAKKIAGALAAGVLALCPSGVCALPPEGYYDSLEGKAGTELWKAVKAAAKKGHRTISYGDNTWSAFRSTDVRTIGGRECWWDMYSDNNVPVSSGHPGMNIEHSVANSWWGGTKNDAYKDIVHLNPSNQDANSRKGNYPLGIVGTGTWDNGVTFVGNPAAGYGGGNKMVYEPHDMYKGDFARVFMYMFVTYDDISWTTKCNWMYDTSSQYMMRDWAARMLLEWNAKDAVSDKEKNRNDGIYKEQKNRNPFIDLPDLADYLWGAKRGEAYHVDGEHLPDNPGSPDNPDVPDVPGVPDVPEAAEGKYMLATSAADIADGNRYILVASESNLVMSTGCAATSIQPAKQPAEPENGIISVLPDGSAILTLKRDGSGYDISVADASGKSLGYVTVGGAKIATYSATPTPADISVDAAGRAAISFGNAGNFIFNKSASMFRPYTSAGDFAEGVSLYRFIPVTTGLRDIEEDIDDSFLVEVWGNNIIAPEGARIFDLNGREVSGLGLSHGVYVVTKPTFRKAIKIRL